MVYVVGNHDAELWWNPRIRRTLQEAGLVDVVGLSYAARFASLPELLIYCEHGNQFDPANSITDYANPLDTPVGAHVLAEMIRPIRPGAPDTRSLNLAEVHFVFPIAAHPGPAEWIAGRIFSQFLGQLLRWLLRSWPCWSWPTSPTGGWRSSWDAGGSCWRCTTSSRAAWSSGGAGGW